jgi:hypothetical protein
VPKIPLVDTRAQYAPLIPRLEERFRAIEAKRGWEAAAEWWNETGWPRYYARCGGA